VICYTNAHDGIVPFNDGPHLGDWTRNSQYMAAFQRDGGIDSREMFYCPTSPAQPNVDDWWFHVWWLYIGYNYVANRAAHAGGWWLEAEKPIVQIDEDYDGWAPAQRLLFVDRLQTAWTGADLSPMNNHSSGGTPSGSNHLYGDGHVQWWPWNQLRVHPVWDPTWAPIHHQLWDSP
jgi:hypothetical protein